MAKYVALLFVITIAYAEPSSIDLRLDGIGLNKTIDVFTSVNITAIKIAGDADIQIYINGSLINNSFFTFSSLGIFNITAKHPQTSNFSESYATLFVFVQNNISNITVGPENASAIDIASNTITNITIDAIPFITDYLIDVQGEGPTNASVVFISPENIGVKDGIKIKLNASELVNFTVKIQPDGFTAVDNNAISTVKPSSCFWKGIAKTQCGNKTIGDGDYTINVTIIDMTGNMVSDISKSIIIDNKLPSIKIMNPYDGSIQKSSIPLAYTIVDSSPVTCKFSINNDQPSSLADCRNVSISLEDGLYNLTVYATDAAGNTASSIVLFSVMSIEIPIKNLSSVENTTTSVISNLTKPITGLDTVNLANSANNLSKPTDNLTEPLAKTNYTSTEISKGFRFQWDKMPLHVNISVPDFNPASNAVFTEISFVLNKNQSSTIIDILDAEPKEELQNVFRYVEIVENISDVKNVSIKFFVNRSWLDLNNFSKNDVMLARYTNSWHTLNTTILNEDAFRVLYSAKSPGLSMFAIFALRTKNITIEQFDNVSTPQQDNITTPQIYLGAQLNTSVITSNKESIITGMLTESILTKNYSILVFVILGALTLLLILFFKRRSHRKVVYEYDSW